MYLDDSKHDKIIIEIEDEINRISNEIYLPHREVFFSFFQKNKEKLENCDKSILEIPGECVFEKNLEGHRKFLLDCTDDEKILIQYLNATFMRRLNDLERKYHIVISNFTLYDGKIKCYNNLLLSNGYQDIFTVLNTTYRYLVLGMKDKETDYFVLNVDYVCLFRTDLFTKANEKWNQLFNVPRYIIKNDSPLRKRQKLSN